MTISKFTASTGANPWTFAINVNQASQATESAVRALDHITTTNTDNIAGCGIF